MLNFSTTAVESHNRPAIILFLVVATLFFASGFLLGASEGREERVLLKKLFAAQEATTAGASPCAPTQQNFRSGIALDEDRRKEF